MTAIRKEAMPWIDWYENPQAIEELKHPQKLKPETPEEILFAYHQHIKKMEAFQSLEPPKEE